jgi:hypothetical protein
VIQSVTRLTEDDAPEPRIFGIDPVTNKADGHLRGRSMGPRRFPRETEALPILLERHDPVLDIVR